MNAPGYSFHNFWKLPAQQVAFNAEVDVDAPCLVRIRMPEPAAHSSGSALYDMGGGHFYARLSPVEGDHKISQILGGSGQTISDVTLEQASNTILLPFNLDEGIWNLLNESYLKSEKEQALMGWLRKVYYALKPVLPRSLQMVLRRRTAARMALRTFPAWPVDSSADALLYAMAGLILSRVPGYTLPMISFWPRGYDHCLVLTHDVETQVGFDNIHRIVEIERRNGFRSVWNIVAERYVVDEKVLQSLRADGFELGIHGLHHDGKMFQSRQRFLDEVEEVNRYLERWKCRGFRSPSLLRNLDWLSDHIQADYDSSLPSSEFYGAQPGGCCTVFPFICPHCGDRLVELPVTLQEDHTLLETLGLSPAAMLSTWLETVNSIKSLHGMALLIAHPDYLLTEERLKAYETFLQTMKADAKCWCPLPGEASDWWHHRHASNLVQQEGAWIIDGPAVADGQVMAMSLKGGSIHIKPLYPSSAKL